MIKPCPTCNNAHDPANECREVVPVAEQLRESLAEQKMTEAEVLHAWILLTHAFYSIEEGGKPLLDARLKLYDESYSACELGYQLERLEVDSGFIEVRRGYKWISE